MATYYVNTDRHDKYHYHSLVGKGMLEIDTIMLDLYINYASRRYNDTIMLMCCYHADQGAEHDVTDCWTIRCFVK